MAAGELKVQVKLTSGRTAFFPVPPATTTHELCQKVAAEENVQAEIVTLKFDGKVLKRRTNMIDYGVREEMVLKVKMLTKVSLKVNMQLPGDEVVSFDIYNTSLLEEVKRKLTEAKPDLQTNILTFHIGQMKLDLGNYAYEDCLEDGEKIEVRVTVPGGVEEPVVEMQEEERQEVLNSFAAAMTSERKVDIVFSFDTTGSMYSLLSTIQQRLRECVTRLMADIPNIQIGIMAHGDYCDEHLYVLRQHDLSPNVSDLVSFVNDTPGSGGQGNYACYEWVLRNANQLSWREDAAKALVIIGDVVPHPTSYTNLGISWRDELEALCEKEVKVYGVQAQDFSPANSFYGYMARRSGGAHIKFQHFNLITDMFLAVCYRESGDDQLQAYVAEVENEGRMTEEMMDVMKQLEKKPEEEEEEEEKEEEKKEEGEVEGAAAAAAEEAPSRPRRQQEEEYVAEAWWDSTLDGQNTEQFTFNEDTRTWSRNSPGYEEHSPSRFGRNSSKRFSRRFKGKKGCLLM